MWKKLLTITAPLLIAICMVGNAAGQSLYVKGSDGIDVSYPNCSTILPRVAFGVVGVANGVVYGQNPCLKSQASHFSDLSLYINTGLNASQSSTYYQTAAANCGGDLSCAAYNYGYNAAKNALAYAGSQGVTTTRWWLDVETSNTWNTDVNQNKQSLLGSYTALQEAGALSVGVYSTTAQWQTVTGGWQNNWPSWGATTWTTAKQAATYCTGHQFTGGPSLLMQYKSKQSKVDQDYAC